MRNMILTTHTHTGLHTRAARGTQGAIQWDGRETNSKTPMHSKSNKAVFVVDGAMKPDAPEYS